jgi:hypothetical protein
MENALKNMVANKKSKTLQKNKEGTVEMNLKDIKSMSGVKKYLTTRTLFGYSESLKTTKAAFTPRKSVFFISMLRGMRVGNIQYRPKQSLVAFSESPICSFFRWFLRKTKDMKENLQNIIEELNQPINSLNDRLGKFALLEIYAKENANG